mgnify:FL=1
MIYIQSLFFRGAKLNNQIENVNVKIIYFMAKDKRFV